MILQALKRRKLKPDVQVKVKVKMLNNLKAFKTGTFVKFGDGDDVLVRLQNGQLSQTNIRNVKVLNAKWTKKNDS